MKNILLIAIFYIITLPFQNAFSQEYYIKYGVKDCANCNYYLHQLSQELDGRAVSILFPNRFETDSSLMVSQLGLAKFNYTLVFDDSIYKHFVKGDESHFIAVADGKMFKTKLKEFDLKGVQAILQADKLRTVVSDEVEVCVIKKNSDNHYDLINDSTIISSSGILNRVTFQDISSKSFIEIIPDTNWTKMAYQKYYGENNYIKKYEIYLKLLAESPTVMQTTISHSLHEDNILYLYSDVRTWEYKDSVREIVSANTVMTIFSYDINTQKLINCIIVPSVEDLGRYHLNNVGQFIKHGDMFYFFLLEENPTDTSKVMVRYKQRGDKLIFDQIMDFTVSKNYVKYQLGNNFATSIINEHLFSFQLSDRIYDIRTGKMIKIPIEEEEYESLNGLVQIALKSIQEGENLNKSSIFYSLFSLADKGKAYAVLYKDSKNNLIELLFDKETGKILKKKKINVNVREVWGINYHPKNNNKMVYYNVDAMDGCIQIIDL